MMAERTLIRVDDVDFFKQAEGAREQYRTIFADLPEYCCLVLYYDTAEWKPNGTMRKLNEVFQTKCERVEFGKQAGTRPCRVDPAAFQGARKVGRRPALPVSHFPDRRDDDDAGGRN